MSIVEIFRKILSNNQINNFSNILTSFYFENFPRIRRMDLSPTSFFTNTKTLSHNIISFLQLRQTLSSNIFVKITCSYKSNHFEYSAMAMVHL